MVRFWLFFFVSLYLVGGITYTWVAWPKLNTWGRILTPVLWPVFFIKEP